MFKERASPIWTPYGLTSDFHPTIIWEVFGSEAKAAGFQTHDEIVAVDGRSVVGAGLHRMRKIMHRSPGKEVTLTVRASNGSLEQRKLHWQASNVAAGEATPGRKWERGTSAYIAFGLAQALLNVVASILLFGRRRDPMAALFSIALLALNFYGVGEPIFYELGLFRVQLLGAFTGFSLLLVGLMAFPSGTFVPRWTGFAAMLVPIWGLLGFFFNYGHNLLVAFGVQGLLITALAAIWSRYRSHLNHAERQQVRWFLLGLAGSATFVACQLVVRSIGQSWIDAPVWLSDLWRFFSTMATAAFVAGLVVSIRKFRLYDADAVIERSVTLGVLTLGLLGIFAGSEKIIEVLGEEYFGDRLGALAGGLGAAVAAVMISPLHHRIATWAEHRFQKNLRYLRLQLPLIVGDLRETAGVAKLSEAILDEVATALRPQCSVLIVGDKLIAARGADPGTVSDWQRGWIESEQDGLDRAPADSQFPLRLPLVAIGHGRVGWLLLGPRPDGSFYGKDELEALAQVADPIARALDITSERDRERASSRAAVLEMSVRLANLESQIAELQAGVQGRKL